MSHVERMIAGNTGFAIALFRELVKREAGANVFVSPWSVASVLALAYNGAQGRTAQAMARVLGWDGMAVDDVNRGLAEMETSMQEKSGPGVKLGAANALWAAASAGLIPVFVDVARDIYRADAREADLADPAALIELNAWVRSQTAGKIERILDVLDPATVLVLVNAVYFDGRWKQPFDPAATHEGDFTLADGRKKRHPMMDASGRYNYLHTADLQVVRLSYGFGRFAMFILLPRQGMDLGSFVAGLSAAEWEGWLAQMREREGRVILPRFKAEYGTDLVGALTALGMGPAFDVGAEFGGLARTPLAIDQIQHRALVDVNEEGTVAAAATAGAFALMGMRIETPFHLVVDRPFVCAIRDYTGMLLFIGAINDPK